MLLPTSPSCFMVAGTHKKQQKPILFPLTVETSAVRKRAQGEDCGTPWTCLLGSVVTVLRQGFTMKLRFALSFLTQLTLALNS